MVGDETGKFFYERSTSTTGVTHVKTNVYTRVSEPMCTFVSSLSLCLFFMQSIRVPEYLIVSATGRRSWSF